MKKTLIGLFLVLGAASFADAGKVEVKGGIDFGGKYHYEKDWKTQKTKNSSGEIGVEYRNEIIPGLEVGGGTAFQFHKGLKDKIKGQNEKNYNSVPVYATTKYTFDTQTVVKPYIKGDLGYSFNRGNYDHNSSERYKAKNGLYYGAGGGISFNNVNVELMYKENQGEYKYEGSKKGNSKDANYRRVSLGVGYNFNLGN